MNRVWPATLREPTAHGVVMLRPLTRRDGAAWSEVRTRCASWLQPWEATVPGMGGPVRAARGDYRALLRSLATEVRLGVALPWAITLDDRFVGQLTVGSIQWGSALSAYAGYWVDRDVAGRGVVPTALAMAVDHCFWTARLHRVEVNIRPENAASLRVVHKLGFRDEGLRRAYLHIDGGWRDHRTFALTADDVPGGLLARWRATTARREL